MGGGGKGKRRRGTGIPLDGLEDYLDAESLPESPWCAGSQTTFVAPNSRVARANELSNGSAILTPVGTALYGEGRLADPPTAVADFGAIIYSYQQGTQIYALYGTGKKGGATIMAGAASNTGK